MLASAYIVTFDPATNQLKTIGGDLIYDFSSDDAKKLLAAYIDKGDQFLQLNRSNAPGLDGQYFYNLQNPA